MKLQISPINFNINKTSKIIPIQTPKNKKYNNNNKTPLTKLKDLYSRNYQKILKNNNNLKKMQKHIIFNKITNIQKDFLDNFMKFKLNQYNHNNKRNHSSIRKNFGQLNFSNFRLFKNNNSNNFENSNIYQSNNYIIPNNDKMKKYNILLTNKDFNFNMSGFNKSLFNKSKCKLKTNQNEIKCNNMNIFFDMKNFNSPFKYKVQNSYK